MQFSRYLYEKIKESNSKFVFLILNNNEIEFLNMFNVHIYEVKDSENVHSYLVNSYELKELFCN